MYAGRLMYPELLQLLHLESGYVGAYAGAYAIVNLNQGFYGYANGYTRVYAGSYAGSYTFYSYVGASAGAYISGKMSKCQNVIVAEYPLYAYIRTKSGTKSGTKQDL